MYGLLWCSHVYGHSNHEWNDRADDLAKRGKSGAGAAPRRSRQREGGGGWITFITDVTSPVIPSVIRYLMPKKEAYKLFVRQHPASTRDTSRIIASAEPPVGEQCAR